MKTCIRLLLLCSWMLAISISGMAQESAFGKGLHIGVSLGAGTSMISADGTLDPATSNQLSLMFRADAAWFFTPNIGVGLSPGYLTHKNTITATDLNTMETISAGQSLYSLNQPGGPALGYQLKVGETLNEEIVWSFLDIPLMLKFRVGNGKARGYLDLGVAYSLVLGNPSITGTGTVEFTGQFDNYDYEVYDTGFGFQEATVTATGDPAGFATSMIAPQAGLGFAYALSEKLEIQAGVTYRLGVTNMVDDQNDFAWLESSSPTYESIASRMDQVNLSGLGGRIGINYYLGAGGGGGPKPPKKPKDAPCNYQLIPTLLTQALDSRRDKEQFDPEFTEIEDYVNNRLVFAQPNVSLKTGGIEYCPQELSPDNIRVEMAEGTEGVAVDTVESGFQIADGNFLIAFRPEKASLLIEPVDEVDGSAIDIFTVKVEFQGQEILSQLGGFSEAIDGLYAHPSVFYRIKVDYIGYETAAFDVSYTDMKAGFISIKMKKSP